MLNPAQREAVGTLQGPLLVLAGAGSGKTRVITTRIAHLLARGNDAASILAVTFTNKAAAEMRERLIKTAGEQARAVTVGTFHAFCVRVLREHGKALGLSRRFTICDASDQMTAIKSVMRELRVHETTMQPANVLARISLAKNRMLTPERLLDDAKDGHDQLVGSVWRGYQKYLTRSRTLDFDDLLLETVRLLAEHDEIREHYATRYKYILVDEYQDTNHPQYEIVRHIGGEHSNVCVVGDDDQSIYGWRGADIRKILGFHNDFVGAKVIRLQTNYRSTQPILDAANAVIGHNESRHDKQLESAKGAGEPVRRLRMKDEVSEAQFVIKEIQEQLESGHAQPSEFAILCRTQIQFRPFEAELRGANIPYVVAGGMSFFDRKEVRDVIAYLKLAVHANDETALLRVINTPPRGVGKTSVDKVVAFATDHGISASEAFERADEIEKLSPQSIEGYKTLQTALDRADLAAAGRDLVPRLETFLESIDYREEVRRVYPDPMVRDARWAGVLEVLNFAENYIRGASDPTLHEFLERLALSGGDDQPETADKRQENAVKLMTLHAAKGLEYPQVFLVGMEEGLLPHTRAVAEGSVEEERRLAYVGITRAMDALTMSWAFERAKYGRRARSTPSRFLFEAEGETTPEGWIGVETIVERQKEEEDVKAAKTKRKKRLTTRRRKPV